MKTFDQVTYDDDAQLQQRDLKSAFEHVEEVLARNFRIPAGTYMSIEMQHARDKLQESSMWANREIRRRQIERSVAVMKKKGI